MEKYGKYTKLNKMRWESRPIPSTLANLKQHKYEVLQDVCEENV